MLGPSVAVLLSLDSVSANRAWRRIAESWARSRAEVDATYVANAGKWCTRIQHEFNFGLCLSVRGSIASLLV